MTGERKKMGKPENYKQKKNWVVIDFAIGAALGALYGAFVLGPAIESIVEGTALGFAIGIGAGVSLGTFYEIRTSTKGINKKETKLLIAVVIATLLLVLSTAFMAYSDIV